MAEHLYRAGFYERRPRFGGRYAGRSSLYRPGLPDKIRSNDPNTAWRIEYWADETSAVADTEGMGLGFGTTYASYEFTEPQSEMLYNQEKARWEERPFSKNDTYTKEQRPYVTASHNSFVSVGFRQGILGLGLLLAFLINIWSKVFACKKPESSALLFAFCAEMLIIATNVGLESPMYLISFVGTLVLITAVTNSRKRPAATATIQ